MSKNPCTSDKPTGISNSRFETIANNLRLHFPRYPLRVPMQVRWRISKQDRRVLISRFQTQAFTPVYRRWKNAPGVPLCATIRDARRALDGEISLRMSFQNQQIRPDSSSSGRSRSLVARGADGSATVHTSCCSLPQMTKQTHRDCSNMPPERLPVEVGLAEAKPNEPTDAVSRSL